VIGGGISPKGVCTRVRQKGGVIQEVREKKEKEEKLKYIYVVPRGGPEVYKILDLFILFILLILLILAYFCC
jgi:hypothetical protein